MIDNKKIDNLLDKSLGIVLSGEKNISALELIINRLRNRSLDDNFDTKEQREYLKILTSWIKMTKDKEDKKDLYTGIILK